MPSFLNAGLSCGERLRGRVGPDGFVAIDDDRVALALRNRDRQDLVLEPAGLGRPRRLLVTARGVLVLRGAIDVVVLGHDLAGVPHVALLERAPQPVVDHRVDDLAVAHAQPVAHPRQQVRAVAHRLHAAGDRHVDVAHRDRLVGEHHRLQSRPADFVDGERGDVIGQAAAQRRLARRILSEAGRDDVAHDAFVDDRGVDAGPAHRLGDDERAKLRAR